MQTFAYLHSSGRFDRPPAQVRLDLGVWLRDTSVSLLTLTEFKGNHRVAVLDEDPAWSLYNGEEKPGADDVVVVWRKDEWRLLETDSAVLSTKKSYSHTGHLIPPQRATTVLLEHRPTGHTLLVSVSHLSSHVEVPGGLRESLRSEVWKDATRSWHRHLRSLRKAWKPTARLVVADWNVNLRAPWFRVYLSRLFPAMRPVWQRPYPKRGTLRRRLIDIPLVSWRLAVTSGPRLLRQHVSSDHTAFRVGLGWRS